MVSSEDLANVDADKDLETSPPARPGLITLVMVVLYVSAIAAPLSTGWDLMSGPEAIKLSGGVASGEDLTTRAGRISLLSGVIYCLLLIMFAEFIRWKLWWTREAMFGLCILSALNAQVFSVTGNHPLVPQVQPLMGLLQLTAMITLCVVAYWYFYKKPNVKAYYDSLS